jgi:transcriptional regulator with XRE-family HTH domain
MPSNPTNPKPLFDTIIDALRHGPRTTTYKLATMMALLDFSSANHSTPANGTLDVPIFDLARIVIELYWQQTRPFSGRDLRQSRTYRSRILDAVAELQTAVGGHDAHLTSAEAASVEPEAFQRTVETVGIYLARLPLPRLQRSPGSAKSVPFMYDDSFLHDNVTRRELEQHNNAIQLLPGVASKLVAADVRLRSAVRVMWTYDVLSINGISRDKMGKLATHLFGTPLSETTAQKKISIPSMRASSASAKDAGPPDQTAIPSLAKRLNHLFETHRAPDGQPFSSGEVAAKIRKLGFPMSVSTVTQLRSGTGPPPSIGALRALAAFFEVRPSYLAGESQASAVDSIKRTLALEHRSPTPQAQPDADAELQQPLGSKRNERPAASVSDPGDTSTPFSSPPDIVEPVLSGVAEDDSWGTVVGPELGDVQAACQVRSDGCWLAPTNKSVRCRAENDSRSLFDLPKIALHRWAWMISNDLTATPIPSHLIQIRRRCDGYSCCNPAHLYATQPGGGPLTEEQLKSLFGITAIPTNRSAEVPGDDVPSNVGRFVLPDNISAIASHCAIEKTGCWIAPTAAPVACRADGDERDAKDLPQLAFHRWAWMVVHGFASNPLPGNEFQVRRFCGKNTCCKPDHLYLAGLDGRELPISAAETRFKSSESAGRRAETEDSRGTGRPVAPSPRYITEGGKHRKPTTHGREDLRDGAPQTDRPATSISLFADRLNRLFDIQSKPDGTSYTSAEVATLLQEDGLAISESLMSRIRAATGDLPAPQTTEALSYFFNVDADYFLAAAHSVGVDEGRPADARNQQTPPALTGPRVQIIPMTVAEIGRIVSVLSQITSNRIDDAPSDMRNVGRLLEIVAELGRVLATPRESFIISRLLLTRIVTELTLPGDATNPHQAIVLRLHALLNES